MKRRDDPSGKGGKSILTTHCSFVWHLSESFGIALAFFLARCFFYELWFERREKRGVQNLGDQEKRMHEL